MEPSHESLATGRRMCFATYFNQKKSLWKTYSIISMSALHRLRVFSFCSASGTVLMYNTLPSGISIITYNSSQLGVVGACVYWLKPLWRGFESPSWVGLPLIWESLFQIKEQSLSLLFSFKCRRKKMIPYFLSLVVFFLLSQLAFPWTRRTPWGRRSWVARAKEKAFADKLRVSRGLTTSNSPPSGTLWHLEKGGNPLPTGAPCFCSKVSLGWQDPASMSVCSAKEMGAKATAQLGLSLVTTRVTCSPASLRGECQDDIPNASEVA